MDAKGKYCIYRGHWSSVFKLALVERETAQFFWIVDLEADGSGGKGRVWRRDKGDILALYSTKEEAVTRARAANAAWAQHDVVIREAEAAVARAKEIRKQAALSEL